MSQFVIAGSSDCPYYAKVELLADQLAVNLPEFKIHKIVKPKEEWDDWLKKTCDKNEWEHAKSPIVWRELVYRGGKGSLIGGFNEFMEYANCYYGVTSEMMTELMLKISNENNSACRDKIEEKNYYLGLSKPIKVCITNASGPVAYNLIPSIASGDVFGNKTEIALMLLDNEENMSVLKGIEMDTFDLACPLLRKITLTTDAELAFKEASAVFFLDEVAIENEEGQIDSRTDWLKRNANLFEEYAKKLSEVALSEVKVVVAGEGPVNFNTHVLIENATNILKQNIVAASRLQERRARALIARKLDVNSAGIKDTIVWGDCSYDGAANVHVDVSAGRCHGYDGAIWGPKWFSRSVMEMVHDNKWISTDYITEHRDHQSKLNEKLKHKSSFSAASALASLMHDWIHGTEGDEMFSLGVECEGWYDIKDCVFSLPVRFQPGSYQVVWDLKLDEETKKKLKDVENNIKKDLQAVFPTEESTVDSGMDSSVLPSKTPGGDKLEKIEEEDNEERKSEAVEEEKIDSSEVKHEDEGSSEVNQEDETESTKDVVEEKEEETVAPTEEEDS